jgi:3-dehydroquinate synthase
MVYRILIGPGLLSRLGEETCAALPQQPRRAAVISNPKVFGLFGEVVEGSLRAVGLQVSHWLMKDGEQNKTLLSWERALGFLSESRLERNDVVVALGGGVVGDLAGFAAATYLRGIAFIQAPTTLLAQIDASVGGKTGVNLPAGKNLAGTFHQPAAVVIDSDTLNSLPPRELTAGWCEAVKQGAVGSRRLFNQTVRLLAGGAIDLGQNSDQNIKSELCATIAAQCRFKASIVAGDEREDIGRMDGRSRRILNFGHTTAHALESVTGYRRFRHGEAVGYGMLVAGELAKNLGMLAAAELQSLREAVTLCGSLPPAHDVDIADLMRAMRTDKKSVAGHLKWVLLERIGKARIVGGEEIDNRTLRASLRAGLRNLE